MNNQDRINSEVFYNFLLELIRKVREIKKRYNFDTDQVPEILDSLSSIIDGMEALNNEMNLDFKDCFNVLINKLKKHYAKFEESEEIAWALDVYEKYFPGNDFDLLS